MIKDFQRREEASRLWHLQARRLESILVKLKVAAHDQRPRMKAYSTGGLASQLFDN